MSDRPGYSVYLSQFEQQQDSLAALYRRGSSVFTSFHIGEEFNRTYVERATAMCRWLRDCGYEIEGDVSRKTLDIFGEPDLIHFADRMNVSVLRIDCGFSVEETAAVAALIPVCINASTVSADEAAVISGRAKKLYALHNFYPRPETGLEPAFFTEKNIALEKYGISVSAFIPGNNILRGPVFEGLPTLERHRNAAPWAAFRDMRTTYHIDSVFVGDGTITPYESARIEAWIETGVTDLPVCFTDNRTELYGAVFTVRRDSPSLLMRLEESREYASAGRKILPASCTERNRGVVTMDNSDYGRYSGEIQIIRKKLPADHRVNVIGRIPDPYLLLLETVANGTRIRFVKPDSSRGNR